MKNNQVVVGGAVLFKDARGRRLFLIVRQKEGGWEIPKVTVRKGESSVRAVLRMTTEQAGMNAKVLEEAGRGNSVANMNGKTVTQKYYYYLMLQRSAGELIGFEEFKWVDYSQALKRLELKREKDILKNAKEVLKTWEKTHKVKNQ